MLNKAINILKGEVTIKACLLETLQCVEASNLAHIAHLTDKKYGYTVAHLLAFASPSSELREFKNLTGSGAFTNITVEDVLEFAMAGKKPLYISVALFNKERELLVQDHVKRGCWCPVGGMVNEGENILTAAMRELNEETLLDESDVSFINCSTYECETYVSKVMWYFHCSEKEPVNAETKKHREQKWCSIEELESMELNQTLAHIVESVGFMLTNIKKEK